MLTILEWLYFWWASDRDNRIIFVVSGWLSLHAMLALFGFYQVTDVMPPRLTLVFAPVIVVVIILGLSGKAKKFRSQFDLQKLHYIHLVRIPVEVFFLYGLYQYGYVAQEVTFEGNNWDIIPGITMPIAALLFWRYKIINTTFLIFWNLLCFCILLFTISQAILSAPFPFQQFSLDQPTTAVLFFPFIWLPAFVAPLVLLSHLICIKRLIEFKNMT